MWILGQALLRIFLKKIPYIVAVGYFDADMLNARVREFNLCCQHPRLCCHNDN